MSVKYTLGVISDVFGVHVTYWLLGQTDEFSTIFNPSSVIYIIAQANSSTFANIYWLI